ncbi:MAG TPA: hypothetical protein VFC38_13175 [Stellaceae bacterium]|nr:hypothetical protein [Stellaceae bacterium]
MYKPILTAAAALLIAAPAFAQTATSTTETRTVTSSPMEIASPPPPDVMPVPGSSVTTEHSYKATPDGVTKSDAYSKQYVAPDGSTSSRSQSTTIEQTH